MSRFFINRDVLKVFFIFNFFVLSISYSQKQSPGKKYSAIDVSGFANSAHHWYDIYSNDNIIEPKKDQPKYKPEQIIEIADNILLYQKNNGGWPKNYDMLKYCPRFQ